MKKIAFIVIIVLLISGCNELKQGIVIKKWHEAARTYVQMIPITTVHTAGKTTYTTMKMIPYVIYDDEDFCILIEGKTDRGKTKQETYYLTEGIYEAIRVGDTFITDKGTNKDIGNTKKRSAE